MAEMLLSGIPPSPSILRKIFKDIGFRFGPGLGQVQKVL